MTRILVTGCRHWAALHVAETIVGRLAARYGEDGFVVVHGDCPTGVDAAFADACRRMRRRAEPFPAAWDDLEAPGAVVRRRKDGTRYNAEAGPARNQRMVDAGAACCLAVHRDLGRSRGTRDCVARALRAGIPTWWIAANDCAAVRVRGFRGVEVA